MVQATALLVAIALTVTVSSALAAKPNRQCLTLRHFTSGYTAEQLLAMADNYRLTDDQKRDACACVFGSKHSVCRKLNK